MHGLVDSVMTDQVVRKCRACGIEYIVIFTSAQVEITLAFTRDIQEVTGRLIKFCRPHTGRHLAKKHRSLVILRLLTLETLLVDLLGLIERLKMRLCCDHTELLLL